MRISDWSSDVCSSDLRLLIKHHIAEQAVLEMVFEVGRELRIANDEVARRIEQSRAIHHAVRRVVELARHDEDGLGRPRQPIAHLCREARKHHQSHRYIVDRRWRTAGVDAIRYLEARKGT